MNKKKKRRKYKQLDRKKFLSGVVNKLKEAEEAKRKSCCFFEKMILNEKINTLRGVCASLILLDAEAKIKGGKDV